MSTRFSVSYAGIRLSVRVLPTVADVHNAYGSGAHKLRGHMVHAFFVPPSPAAKSAGTIVLPAVGDLHELIPHETVHAVMHKMGGVHCTDDESLATAVGVMSAKISKKMERINGKN